MYIRKILSEKAIQNIKSMSLAKVSFYFFDALARQSNFNLIKFFSALGWYFSDLFKYSSMEQNQVAKIKFKDLLPQLADKTINNPVDYIYILQNAWACEKIFDIKPKRHVDVGSDIRAVTIISQFTPTTMVDIRGVDIKLDNLKFTKGSVLELPFEDESVESLSSICVVEHIGLGRYGDPIDPFGTEKSLIEIQRVVKRGGTILLSVPVSNENSVKFNAHREFQPAYFIDLLSDCNLVENKFIVKNMIKDSFSENDDNVVGLFQFIKK